jgi:UDP:flavonoid glycosyltransferase YjiC (YdhE family)
MATVLLVWELGAGFGHLINLLPLAKGLVQSGHRVVAAIRDLPFAEKVFGNLNITYFQAPTFAQPSQLIDPIRSYAQILYNTGFNDPATLRFMANAWRNLYDCIKPDLIIFDHSPTALLAARGLGAKKALIGTGFFCPIDEYPMADLRPQLGDAHHQLQQDEDYVCSVANRVIASWGGNPLEHLSRLYYEIDQNFLVTFPELDHYCNRPGAEYFGAWANVGGKTPVWPDGAGKRIFVYLKPFPALPNLFALLNDLRFPTIVYAGGIGLDLIREFQSNTLRFETERLDMSQICRHCDAAILNGTHGTTVSMLLAGRPTLQLPMYLEQGLFSNAVERLGAGIVASVNQPDQINMQVIELLQFDGYANVAKRFAQRYADYNPQSQIEIIIHRVEELLS